MIPASHFCLSQRRKGTKAGYAGVWFFWFVVLDWEARGLGLGIGAADAIGFTESYPLVLSPRLSPAAASGP